jgi:hypothetical protein
MDELISDLKGGEVSHIIAILLLSKSPLFLLLRLFHHTAVELPHPSELKITI